MLSVRKRRRAIRSDDQADDALNSAQQDLRYALFRLSVSAPPKNVETALEATLLRLELAAVAVGDLPAYSCKLRAEEEKARIKEAASRR